MGPREAGPAVLVVEDEPGVAALLAEVLAGAGYAPTMTDSALGAVALARRLRPAAVLLDLGLPYRSGGALLGDLKADPATAAVPVLVVSGLADALPPARRALAAGVVAKPFSPAALLAAVRGAVARAAPPAAARPAPAAGDSSPRRRRPGAPPPGRRRRRPPAGRQPWASLGPKAALRRGRSRARTCCGAPGGRRLPMLGPPKARHVDRPVLGRAGGLVPPGHFYRHLEAALDLSFVRDWSATATPPHRATEPRSGGLFKLQLILFFEGLRSERKLIETASLHLAHRWYLGYALDEPLPDHSTLSKLRQRLGVGVFRRFFEHVVELCRRPGWCGGRSCSSTPPGAGQRRRQLGRAPAGAGGGGPRRSPLPRGRRRERRAACRQRRGRAASGGVVPLPPRRPATPRPRDAPAGSGWCWRRRGGTCSSAGRLDPARPGRGLPAALGGAGQPHRPGRHAHAHGSGGRAVLGYQTHYVVDGGRARIILHALTTPGDVREGQALLDLLWRVRFRWRVRPKCAVGDSKFGTVENIMALEDEGIRAYFPLADTEHRKGPYYPLAAFAYDAERDEYRCPQGQPLHRDRVVWEKELIGYVADPAVCNACPVKAACTPGTTGRHVHRSLHEAYLERVRAYHATESYKKAMRKRAVWIEPLFGEAKQWHGLRQFRAARPDEGDHREPADGGGAEPQALARRHRLGPAPRPVRGPGPPDVNLANRQQPVPSLAPRAGPGSDPRPAHDGSPVTRAFVTGLVRSVSSPEVPRRRRRR